MDRRPDSSEHAPYHLNYISKVPDGDIRAFLRAQAGEMQTLLSTIDEERSLCRYEPGKWSLREALNHINDTERIFAFRALWLARGGVPALPGFEQDVFAANSNAHAVSWSSLAAEFAAIRTATLSLVDLLPGDAWDRRGSVSNYDVTTRTIVWMIAGHVEHHRRILVEKYL